MADTKTAAPSAGGPPAAPAATPTPAPAAGAAPGAAPAKPATAPLSDEAARKEVVRILHGPVVEIYKTLIPSLAAQPDPYKTVIGSADLLDAAFKLFTAKREAFAALLVDAQGKPVVDDAVRLVCGRSVNEVIGMAVRSGMRAFADQHFGKTAPPAAPKGGSNSRSTWIAAVAGMFRKKPGAPRRAAAGAADVFYKSIRDALDFDWQVPFFPIYVEIPAELFQKMGIGITRLDSIEKLQRLAQLANDDIAKAEQVIGNAALTREMMENNVLAADSIAQMGAENFKMMNDALSHLDVRKKWDVFANKITAMQITGDKRISKADIAAMAEHLDILNNHALNAIVDLKLPREQIGGFLAIAETALTRPVFLALFGPFPDVIAENQVEVEKLKAFTAFVQNSLRGLVTAMQQLGTKFKNDDAKSIADALMLVCESRREGYIREIGKLTPAPITPG